MKIERNLLKTNMLFMTPNDIPLLNKYRLNYICMCKKHDEKKAKEDFIRLARKLCPKETEAIDEFENNFQINLPENERNDQILKWVFKKSFFWDLIDHTLKTTMNPKRIAYLRLPLRHLYNAIFCRSKQKKVIPKTMYIVTELNNREIEVVA